ncbi:head GIN domain-containing protein [Solitalea lacus]|uniref:head GIN domain-containing protein n=1 Tax=Solitalea lacus TaxID=2911172 RepID=UPI001EDB771E|nr:head GIN domain-containing protein [Solitalea lacus]UKJ07735.1 DUF2807 domain-containing protein [Solitalea lacus]
MNFIKKTNLLFALTAIGFASTPEVFATDFSLKNTVTKKTDQTETRNVSGFHGIKVSAGIDVYITQGTTEKVTVTADDDVIGKIKTVVKNGVLEIYEEKSSWSSWSWNNQTRKVYVTAKDLNSIVASSGSDVSSTNQIKANKLFTEASSGADLKLNLNVNELICETSSGSDAELSGTAKSFNVKSSSGSDVDAYKLTSTICVAQASSGSDIDITVTQQLTADASSGGDISYKGNPKNVKKNESSGGDISAN